MLKDISQVEERLNIALALIADEKDARTDLLDLGTLCLQPLNVPF